MRRQGLETDYPLRIRLILFGVLAGLAVTLMAFPRFAAGGPNDPATLADEWVQALDIPETHQFAPPPPPPRPAIPVESDQEDSAEDLTMEETFLDDFEAWEAPPLPDNATTARIRFIPYDEPPVPVGGYGAITANLIYPEIARQAGIEGTVVLRLYVSARGFVEEIVVEKGVPQTGMDEAAIRAVRMVRFKPAMQRDRALGVWIAIPIHFRIAGTGV